MLCVAKEFASTRASVRSVRHMPIYIDLLPPTQHLVFYPLMAIARTNLYIQSLLFIVTIRSKSVNKVKELLCLGVYYTWLGLILSTLPTWYHRVAYVSIGHAVLGFLHVQICLSHFSMPCYLGKAMSGHDADSWFVTQVPCLWLSLLCQWLSLMCQWLFGWLCQWLSLSCQWLFLLCQWLFLLFSVCFCCVSVCFCCVSGCSAGCASGYL